MKLFDTDPSLEHVGFRLPAGQLREIDELATRARLTRSALVRELLDRGIQDAKRELAETA